MVRTWASDDPKAALMTRKRAQIVTAARAAFLEGGYAASSVNRIAADAGVSIKTLYRHFETKDDLFGAVMEAVCAVQEVQTQEPDWFADPPALGLARAGEDYLRHVLSPDQLAIYRVVAQDARLFPEVGRIYRGELLGRGGILFTSYLDRWSKECGWATIDMFEAAAVFAGLLKAGVFDEALFGGESPDLEQISVHARGAADRLLVLLDAGRI